MKIAIITIQDANNYGAVLQAYASKVLFSKFGKVDVLNYQNPHLSGHLDYFRFEPSVHGLKMLCHDVLRIRSRPKVISKLRTFINENLNLTEPFSAEDFYSNENINSYDLYVCGSDQIWNPEIVNKKGDVDPIYFLNFAPSQKKKVAFASSMGAYKFSGKNLKILKDYLSGFSFISVRESQTAGWLSEVLNTKVYHTLDPTLHLNKEEWLSVINRRTNKAKPDGPYILVYTVPRSPLLSSAVKYYKEKLGLQIVLIDQSFKPAINCDVHVKDAGIEEFIDFYYDASFVITDSFHGTCFSLIFEKQFVSVSPGKRANRIRNLLELVHHNDLLLTKVDDLKNFIKRPDFSKISQLLHEEVRDCWREIDFGNEN